MASTQPRYSKQEFARRGDAIYERDIRSLVEPEHQNKFVAIDIETGAFEVDADELAASDRLLARVPVAQIWLRRIGYPYVRHFGPRPRTSASRSPASSRPTARRLSAWWSAALQASGEQSLR